MSDDDMRVAERAVIAGSSTFTQRMRWLAWRRSNGGCDPALHKALGEGTGRFHCPCCGRFEDGLRRGVSNIGTGMGT